jgi:hypothetical protein
VEDKDRKIISSPIRGGIFRLEMDRTKAEVAWTQVAMPSTSRRTGKVGAEKIYVHEN